jgi:hypothetical protein
MPLAILSFRRNECNQDWLETIGVPSFAIVLAGFSYNGGKP